MEWHDFCDSKYVEKKKLILQIDQLDRDESVLITPFDQMLWEPSRDNCKPYAISYLIVLKNKTDARSLLKSQGTSERFLS